jgi:alanine dehydrogenase
LSASLLPYVLKLAAEGGLSDPALQTGINVQAGKIVHPAVKQALQ